MVENVLSTLGDVLRCTWGVGIVIIYLFDDLGQVPSIFLRSTTITLEQKNYMNKIFK